MKGKFKEYKTEKLNSLVQEVANNHLRNIELYSGTLQEFDSKISGDLKEITQTVKAVENSLVGRIDIYLAYLKDYQRTVNRYAREGNRDQPVDYEAIYLNSPNFNDIIKFINFIGEETNTLRKLKESSLFSKMLGKNSNFQPNHLTASNILRKNVKIESYPSVSPKLKSKTISNSTSFLNNKKSRETQEEEFHFESNRIIESPESDVESNKYNSIHNSKFGSNDNSNNSIYEESYFENSRKIKTIRNTGNKNYKEPQSPQSPKSPKRVVIKRNATELKNIQHDIADPDESDTDDAKPLLIKFRQAIISDKLGLYIISNFKQLLYTKIIYKSEFVMNYPNDNPFTSEFVTDDPYLVESKKNFENVQLTILKKDSNSNKSLSAIIKLMEKFFKYFTRRKDEYGNQMFKGVLSCDFLTFENYFTLQYKAFVPIELIQIDVYLFKFDLFQDYDLYSDKTNLHRYEMNILLENLQILTKLREMIEE